MQQHCRISLGCVRVALMATTFCTMVAGCSDTGSSGSSACEEVYPKVKQCVDSLDCAQISEAEAKSKCEQKKTAYAAATYAASVEACKKAGTGVCDCVDKNKTNAEELKACTLDPASCACAQASPDGGAGASVCEEVYPKVKQCVDNLDCAQISDAEAKSKCEQKKTAYAAATYAASVEACEKAGTGVCDCVDKNKTNAEELKACTLDPASCACAQASPDAGVDTGATGG